MGRKTNPEQYRMLVEKLPQLLEEGLEQQHIAARFGVSRSLVSRIASGKHPKWYLKEIDSVEKK